MSMTTTHDSSGTSAACRSTETEGSKKGSPGRLLLAAAPLLLGASWWHTAERRRRHGMLRHPRPWGDGGVGVAGWGHTVRVTK